MEPWRCLDCSATLGQMRENDNGKDELLLYREAVQLNDDVPADVDVLCVVRHSVTGVRCSVCGKLRSWQRRSNGWSVKREPKTYQAE